MSARVLVFRTRQQKTFDELDPFAGRCRVRVRKLLEDSDWIEAETGYADIAVGMEGVVCGIGDEPGFVEVLLDRNGEQLNFHRTELEVVR